MSYKGMVGVMGWSSNDDETIIKATALFNLISEKSGFMYSDGSNMPDELKEIQNFIEHLRSRRSISIQLLEDLYFHTGEDWQLWDEEENGPYPVDRIFSAMKKFIETHTKQRKFTQKMSNYKFELDEEQIQKFESWKTEQKKKDSRMPTAGERWTFMFTPSGLGTMYAIKDQATGDILDLTDWENF